MEAELRDRYFPSALTDLDGMAREASALLEELRATIVENMSSLAPIDLTSIQERDREEIRTRLLVEGQGGEDKIDEVVQTGIFPRYLGIDTLPRVVSGWPKTVLDGKFFSTSYSTVTESARPDALAQVVGPLRDVVWLCEQATVSGLNKEQWREQLGRASSSLHLLQLWRT